MIRVDFSQMIVEGGFSRGSVVLEKMMDDRMRVGY